MYNLLINNSFVIIIAFLIYFPAEMKWDCFVTVNKTRNERSACKNQPPKKKKNLKSIN